VLSGRTGRLYKGLVTGRQIANEATAGVDGRKYAGLFEVEATVKDGKDPAAVEAAVYEEIERLQKEPVAADELLKVKNQYKANAFRRLSSPFSIMVQLLAYDGLGDWRYINTSPEKADAVTAEDLQRTARDYLTRENRTVGVFLRKEGALPEDPEVAALPAPAQAMVKQALAQIASETDPARLREGIARMQQAAEQAPAEVKPGIALVVKRAQERLATLEKK
jgi:hypothetical protein